MKLAEALQLRADLNTKIAQLKQRIYNNAVVQEGEEPAEDPKELIRELDQSIDELETLIQKINLANCRTIVEGKTLTEWIAIKDCLKIRIEAYQEIVSRSSNLCGRMTRTEIKTLATLSAKDIQKKADSLSAELRKTDNLIQQTNWTVEL